MTKKRQAAKDGVKISNLSGSKPVTMRRASPPQIDDWLNHRAKKALESETARIYVVCRGTKRVIGEGDAGALG